jgi:hypothetical protein
MLRSRLASTTFQFALAAALFIFFAWALVAQAQGGKNCGWTGSQFNGAWEETNNWACGGFPGDNTTGPNDTATIANAFGGPTKLTSTRVVSATTIGAPGVPKLLIDTGGNLTVNADLTVGDVLGNNPGTLVVTGSLTVNGAAYTYSGSALTVASGGVVQFNGLVINNGSITVESGGTLIINSPGNLTTSNAGVLSINGTLDVRGGDFYLAPSGALQINGAGEFIFSSPGSFFYDGSLGVDGVLRLAAGSFSSSSGSFSIAGSGLFEVAGGTLAVPSEERFTFGELAYSGGSISIGNTSTLEVSIMKMSGATTLALTESSSELVISDTLEIGPAATLTIGNGGYLSGPGTMTVQGQLKFYGGTMGGGPVRVTPSGLLTIDPAALSSTIVDFDGRSVENFGTLRWLSGDIRLSISNNSRIDNRPGGLFEISSSGRILGILGLQQALLQQGPLEVGVSNGGLMRKIGATTAIIDTAIPFANYGTLAADEGILIVGALTNFVQNFRGGDDALIGGRFEIRATLSYTGTATDLLIADLLIDGPNAEISRLNTQGEANAIGDLSQIDTAGRLSLRNNADITAAAILLNRGVLDIDSTSSLTTGTYRQTAGGTYLRGGATINGTVLLLGGQIQGTGTLNGNMGNEGGTLSPGLPLGALTVTGFYAQNNSGRLLIEINGASDSQRDRLL